MTTLIANRQARRRGIVFAILIAITLLLMAFSANPFVQELQRGLSFALRPFQGAIAGFADGRLERASGPSARSTSCGSTTPRCARTTSGSPTRTRGSRRSSPRTTS